ncbi:peptidoglycan-binding protein [Fodinicola acaciae]|uniref:peptidoglycan-binding protein n=1 Tax=Fodinicola acaciae TaxID=2681555 RepID=UPI001C9E8906|nr:peptidoglycan-binding protein [Fodinicola acaciae]
MSRLEPQVTAGPWPDPATDEPDGMARHRRRRRVRAAAITGAVVVTGATVVAASIGIGGRPSATPTGNAAPPSTATVTRSTLTATEQVDGKLGYGSAAPLASAAANGVITWLPSAGSTVTRGHAAYKVDDRPVPLLYGTLPFYRTLGTGMTGSDVRQLERNLSALGYSGFTVDDKFTAATAAAVKDWQDDLGLTETGTVAPNQVALAPAAIRVAEVKASLGGMANGPVYTYTGTTVVVTVALDVAKQAMVKAGQRVTVTMPDGGQVAGTIRSVGKVATTSGDNPREQTSTVSVVIDLAKADPSKSLDQAPVSVTLVTSEVKDVLNVPVNALVALADGGYGVEVVKGAARTYVPVQTGTFAGGRVEISGAGITAGTKVVVPSD